MVPKSVYLNSGDVIRGDISNQAISVDHLPPILLLCTGLVQDEIVAFLEADGFREGGLEVVEGFEHFIVIWARRMTKLKEGI